MSEKKEPQFDADGRDPKLVEFWKMTMRWSAGMTFRREHVPPGISLDEFYRMVLSDAKSIRECAELLQAFIEGRPAVLPADRHLTTSQKWMRWKQQQKRAAEQQAALVDAELKKYLQERESQRGPDDEFVRFMKGLLQNTTPPSSSSEGNQQ